MNRPAACRNQENYQVDLSVFQGPLDLLLYLIRKEEVDIYDIPIARITRQYLKYIEMMTSLDLEVAGEFILMAATLIHIKTRMLLPRDEENPDEEDPRRELMMALIEYKKYKEASDILRERALMEEQNYVPPNPVEKVEGKIDFEPVTTLYDLLAAFKEIMDSKSSESFHEVASLEVTIEERIEYVMTTLKKAEFATFGELFADIPTKLVAVVTFIALLELARSQRITICQSGPFAELRIYRAGRFDAPVDEIDRIGAKAVEEAVKV
ncbi:MAG: segregation/condensation protein A [Candidatus Zixiibacteriota bacterium]|nr:MAG: segregation/condensation protein A [candidate division Zixibacteria bacterium]